MSMFFWMGKSRRIDSLVTLRLFSYLYCSHVFFFSLSLFPDVVNKSPYDCMSMLTSDFSLFSDLLTIFVMFYVRWSKLHVQFQAKKKTTRWIDYVDVSSFFFIQAFAFTYLINIEITTLLDSSYAYKYL